MQLLCTEERGLGLGDGPAYSVSICWLSAAEAPISGHPRELEKMSAMGLMHNYVIQCMRVWLGGIAKQVPRVCVPLLRTGYKYTSLIRKLSGINGRLNSIHLRRKNITH